VWAAPVASSKERARTVQFVASENGAEYAWLDAVGLQNGAEVLRVVERFSNVRAIV
jgi:hypothetical protein